MLALDTIGRGVVGCVDIPGPGLTDLQQAVVDGRALDVEQVDAVVLGKHLEGRVGEADAHRRRAW